MRARSSGAPSAVDRLATPAATPTRLPRISLRALSGLCLVTPATALLVIGLIVPIGLFLWRSVANPEIPATLPRTVAALHDWDGTGLPDEAAYAALRLDIAQASRDGTLGLLAQRLNFISAGYRSLLNKTANMLEDKPGPDARAELTGIDTRWARPAIWAALKQQSGHLTDFYYLTALDLRRDVSGAIVRVPQQERLFLDLFARTLWTSLSVTALCLLLGYPAAHVLASASPRRLPLLMVLVLLPFWTPILVRTTAWMVLLQDQGLLNRLLRGAGLIDGPLPLFGNRFSVLVAMTQQLLPYMILPLYAAMRKVPPELLRAASSLGANPWRAFRRVYLPQTVSGVAAGALIVLILALGYYVTPLLVGGPADQMISYFIAAYTNEYLDWGLASALGTLLLVLAGAIYVLVAQLGGGSRPGIPAR